jgi:hypothetical protein
MTRVHFAERISASLSGWLQQLAAQALAHEVGEDAARVELVRTIGAQRLYVPKTAQRPINWPQTTKKRLDVAVLGRSIDAAGWYGALELKWPKVNIDRFKARQDIVEDAVRVAFADTSNLCANFLIVGGTTAALEGLFETKHRASNKEAQRLKFRRLLRRSLEHPDGSLTNEEINDGFPDFGDRVPQIVFGTWHRRFATTLLARSYARIGDERCGAVYIWQCKR